MSDALVTEGLLKRFGKVEALNGVAFSVRQGELFGIIGADGAGKTTLFRILATLLLPDEGRAEVLGFDTRASYRQIRTRVGYMPGRFSLYHDLSVAENLDFFATVFGTSVERSYDLIRDIYVQLEPFKNRKAGQLSGGMKQKLALCCALVHRPELLLLDEPTTGVDAVSRDEFWQMLQRFRQQGITILVSTPYMDEASLCDRLAFLQLGKMLALDTPSGITNLFRKQLYAISADEKHRLVPALRSFRHTASAYAFGDSVHYTDLRDVPDEQELIAWLASKGINDIRITPIRPGIEDTFISLIEREPDRKQPHG